MIAILQAVTKWRPYLVGRCFRILTDHRSLRHFLDQRVATPAQQKWVTKLMGYDYEVIYRSGHENKVADALSRQTENSTLTAISTPQSTLWNEICAIFNKDDALRALVRKCSDNVSFKPWYKVHDSLLFYKGRLVVPSAPDLRSQILWNSVHRHLQVTPGSFACTTA